jgi:hypothetical protein
MVLDMLPQLASIQDMKELRTTTDADTVLIRCRAVNSCFDPIPFLVRSHRSWVCWFTIQSRIDICSTHEDDEVGSTETVWFCTFATEHHVKRFMPAYDMVRKRP